MIVIADRLRNLVTIHGDRGTEITLTWSAALVLGTPFFAKLVWELSRRRL
jgi:hypothetical protein